MRKKDRHAFSDLVLWMCSMRMRLFLNTLPLTWTVSRE